MTAKQHEILLHTLGLDVRKHPFRNHFATGLDVDSYKDVTALVAAGLMAAGGTIPGALTYYHATDAGVAAAKLAYDEFLALERTFRGGGPPED